MSSFGLMPLLGFCLLLTTSVNGKGNFSTPSSEIGSYLFQLGHNFCDRDLCKQHFLDHYKEFVDIYNDRPDKVNLYGVHINHAYAIYMVGRELNPSAIIESGVNAGQTTYLFRKSCPKSKIISIDPLAESNPGQIKRWIDNTNNDYLTGDSFQDLAEVNWLKYPGIDISNTLVFIDDHQRTFPRMQHLHKQGFVHFLIEDNNPMYMGAARKERGHSPKTILLGQNTEGTKAIWLKDHMETYHEIPPLFYGGNTLSDFNRHNKMHGHHLLQGNFSFLPVYAHPLFRTDQSASDLKLALEFRDLLGFNFKKDYLQFMKYNHITYIKMKKYVAGE